MSRGAKSPGAGDFFGAPAMALAICSGDALAMALAISGDGAGDM